MVHDIFSASVCVLILSLYIHWAHYTGIKRYNAHESVRETQNMLIFSEPVAYKIVKHIAHRPDGLPDIKLIVADGVDPPAVVNTGCIISEDGTMYYTRRPKECDEYSKD